MHELLPLFAVMMVTLVVLAGLVAIFRRWMSRRDRIFPGTP